MITWAVVKGFFASKVGPWILGKLRLIVQYPRESVIVLLIAALGVGGLYHHRVASSLQNEVTRLEDRIQSFVDAVDAMPSIPSVVPDFGEGNEDFEFDEDRPTLTPSVVFFDDVVGEFELELEELTDDEVLDKGRPNSFDLRDRSAGEFARRLKQYLVEQSQP